LATGYTQWGSRAVEEDFTLIAKPYHREALAAAIRAALERENTRRRIAAAETEKTVGI
jgi:FixJ family two-component response regulator